MLDSYSVCSDRERLAALYRYEILDTPPERDFDNICSLAAQICGTEMAILSFVDAERQWFKSEMGLGVSGSPLENSICRHAIMEKSVLVVPDTLADERFSANPFCTGEPGLRFYAGAVIRTPEGHPLGTICALGSKPYEPSPQQIAALETLARQVMTMLELRRSNRELSAAKSELSEALAVATRASAAKDDFLAKLSHELRTPLMPVVMTVGALLEEPGLPVEMREDLATILRNVKLETRLIDDLLDVTRIAHGKLELTLQECDLHEVARDAVRVCLPPLREKEITVELRLEAEQHLARGDAARLQQVFWNLLTNAAKFTPEGGHIVLRSFNSGAAGSTECLFELADNGRGIEPDLIPSLFDAFEQGGRGTTRTYGGLGLGLAICKGVIDLHGGSIAVRSDGPGKGTTFTVKLTTIAPALPGLGDECDDSGVPTRGSLLSILLVEDHEPTAAVLCRLLRRSGNRVEHAPNLEEARRLVLVGSYDLVMSDLGLPDGSGLQLMAELRSSHGLRGIALSGYGMEEDVRRSREAGFVAHLTKPVDIDHLRRTLREVSEGLEVVA